MCFEIGGHYGGSLARELIAEKRAERAMKGWRFVGVMHAMHQRVTNNAASWYTPPALEGKIVPHVKAGGAREGAVGSL